jgi:xanthine dehydrogenase YagS FAD-binding subunit
MNKFNWYDARSIKDAVQKATGTVSGELYAPSGKAAVFKSGGVDLLDMVKEGLLEPDTIVNVRNIPGLNKISYSPDRLSIGANVTLAEIVDHPDVQSDYAALYEAVAHAATPQLRNISTIAGNLAQRNRCWYFRSIDHPCLRKGGDRCFARSRRTGQNENHAILDNGSCVSVYASSIATALLAYNGQVVITDQEMESRVVPMDDFFVRPSEDVSRETILQAGELITEIRLPRPAAGTRAFYKKQVERESYDWSIGDVAIVAEMDGKKCKNIRIVLGAAAPTPYRASEAENLLLNRSITEELAERAAKETMEKARPLSHNEYKLPLFTSTIKQGLLNIALL